MPAKKRDSGMNTPTRRTQSGFRSALAPKSQAGGSAGPRAPATTTGDALQQLRIGRSSPPTATSAPASAQELLCVQGWRRLSKRHRGATSTHWWVLDLSRLTRNARQLQGFVDRLHSSGATLATAGGHDSSSAVGRLTLLYGLRGGRASQRWSSNLRRHESRTPQKSVGTESPEPAANRGWPRRIPSGRLLSS